jgi:hypothetical protein
LPAFEFLVPCRGRTLLIHCRGDVHFCFLNTFFGLDLRIIAGVGGFVL